MLQNSETSSDFSEFTFKGPCSTNDIGRVEFLTDGKSENHRRVPNQNDGTRSPQCLSVNMGILNLTDKRK